MCDKDFKNKIHASCSVTYIHDFALCRVWGLRVLGMDCGNEAASWFQTFLGAEGVRLVVSSGTMPKKDSSMELKPWGNPAQPGDLVMSQNGFLCALVNKW